LTHLTCSGWVQEEDSSRAHSRGTEAPGGHAVPAMSPLVPPRQPGVVIHTDFDVLGVERQTARASFSFCCLSNSTTC
jgi:hypothetical protein